MTPEAVLIEILGRLGASQGATVLVNDAELQQWPAEAVRALQGQKLIVKARPASSAICPGCEDECVMPVQTLSANAGAPVSFIFCDKRSDTTRVTVPSGRLTQWKCTAELVCEFIATSLGLRRSGEQSAEAGLWKIGIASGDNRSQMLCLQAKGELALVAGSNPIPLAELLEYHDGGYSLVGAMIRRLVDAATTADQRYHPSIARREARKLDTQAKHEGWQKEYRKLLRSHPGMSDVWYSLQIGKKYKAKGSKPGTIRKNMKK
ncbi:MAG: hypothetical protein HGA96_08490 [Desulfobulbaceae bacterium]|nr:hypothetical protein [Desulfobulbaceae bacterium]